VSPYSLADGVLITERLALRPWTDDDLASVTGGGRLPHWADDYPDDGDLVIAGLITRTPAARTEFGQRQIIERETGLVVGGVGLFWPPKDGALEFGYGVTPSRQRRGYATEVAVAIVAYGLTAPGVEKVFADVELPNPASVRVLEKAGLHRWWADDERVRYGTTTTP
jgi:RimJ/RimL family protein N-acetyltransferase